jgi:hypothetical protein
MLLLPLMVFAQESEGEAILIQQLDLGQEVLTVPELKTPSMNRIDFGLEAGAAFTSFGRHGSMFSTHLAPEVRYRATPRFHFSAGVVLSTGFLHAPGMEGMTPMGNRFNRVLVYASGDYQVNPRLTVGGMVVKELDNDIYRKMNAFEKNSGFQSIGMNVNYKITDHFHVGASFNVTEGRPYYYNDPANPFIRRYPFSPGW